MKKTIHLFFMISLISLPTFAKSGKPIKIWNGISSMENENTILYAHFPSDKIENRHSAVIICPGGSYHHLGLYNEGHKSAQWFSSKGVTAFTLRYRVAEAGYHYPAMLQDLQRAIQFVREKATEYNIDENKIGIIGYSAGGHLVTMGGASWQSHDELEN